MRTITITLAILALAASGCGKKGEDKPAEPAAKQDQDQPPKAEEKPAATPAKAEKPAEPAPKPATTEVDQGDPMVVAKAALAAYKAKDVDGLLKVSPTKMQKRVAEMKAAGKLEEMMQRAFDETKWRFQSVSSWDGKLHEMKKKGEDKVRIKYADLGENEVAVVQLEKEDGKWCFDDLKSPSKESWATWGGEGTGAAAPSP